MGAAALAMSRVRDRTEDFKESVRVAALSHGYTEVSSYAKHATSHTCAISPLHWNLVYQLLPQEQSHHLRSIVLILFLFSQSQLAALMSSFIIRKPSPKSPFTNAAIKTVELCSFAILF